MRREVRHMLCDLDTYGNVYNARLAPSAKEKEAARCKMWAELAGWPEYLSHAIVLPPPES